LAVAASSVCRAEPSRVGALRRGLRAPQAPEVPRVHRGEPALPLFRRRLLGTALQAQAAAEAADVRGGEPALAALRRHLSGRGVGAGTAAGVHGGEPALTRHCQLSGGGLWLLRRHCYACPPLCQGRRHGHGKPPGARLDELDDTEHVNETVHDDEVAFLLRHT